MVWKRRSESDRKQDGKTHANETWKYWSESGRGDVHGNMEKEDQQSYRRPYWWKSQGKRRREKTLKHSKILLLEGKVKGQRKAKETLREECGGLDGGKCRESGTDSWIWADVWKVHQGTVGAFQKRLSERERIKLMDRSSVLFRTRYLQYPSTINKSEF